MIPLAIFLGIWFILILINGILTLLTLGQFFKYATPSPLAYGYAVVFIGTIVAVVLGCGGYFLNVNWNDRVSPIPPGIQSMVPGLGPLQDIPLEQ